MKLALRSLRRGTRSKASSNEQDAEMLLPLWCGGIVQRPLIEQQPKSLRALLLRPIHEDGSRSPEILRLLIGSHGVPRPPDLDVLINKVNVPEDFIFDTERVIDLYLSAVARVTLRSGTIKATYIVF